VLWERREEGKGSQGFAAKARSVYLFSFFLKGGRLKINIAKVNSLKNQGRGRKKESQGSGRAAGARGGSLLVTTLSIRKMTGKEYRRSTRQNPRVGKRFKLVLLFGFRLFGGEESDNLVGGTGKAMCRSVKKECGDLFSLPIGQRGTPSYEE